MIGCIIIMLHIAGWSSWQLVGLITQRSVVRVYPPQPIRDIFSYESVFFYFCLIYVFFNIFYIFFFIKQRGQPKLTSLLKTCNACPERLTYSVIDFQRSFRLGSSNRQYLSGKPVSKFLAGKASSVYPASSNSFRILVPFAT